MSKYPTKKIVITKRPMTKLGLPGVDHSKAAVLESLRSLESKRRYRHAIDEFIQRYCSEPRLSFNKVVVTRFRITLENRGLAAGTINGRLAAVRRLTYEAADAGLSARNTVPSEPSWSPPSSLQRVSVTGTILRPGLRCPQQIHYRSPHVRRIHRQRALARYRSLRRR